MAQGMGSMVKGAMGIAAGAIAGAGLASLLGDSIKAASDLAESTNKIAQVFGPASKQIEEFAAKGAKALGMTNLEARNAAATFGIFGKSAGLSGKPLGDFATQMTGLATDLASFHNTSPEQAIDAIGAALRGEAEPMRQYGVLLDDATMRQQAMSMGLIKTTKEALTPQQKVLAAQALILAKTKDAQGDFARTSGGLANQQRILSATFEDAKGKLGDKLLPVMTSFATLLNDTVLPAVMDVGGKLSDLAGWVQDNLDVVVPLAAAIAVGTVALNAHAIAVGVVGAATKAWAAVQAVMNVVLSANPIGLVIAALALLAAGIVIAWQRSETFRTVVTGAFKAVQDAGSFMWEKVLKPTFKFLVDTWTDSALMILKVGKAAFGWIGPIGSALDTAIAQLVDFKDTANKVLGDVNDEDVVVGVKFTNLVSSSKKSSTPYLDLVTNRRGDGYGLDSYGRGIGDGLGLDLTAPTASAMTSTARTGMLKYATTSSQLMALMEDSTSGGASGPMKWQALWAAVRSAVPGATLNSAFRPGAITATGNRSYHSMGRAIDIGPANMATFEIIRRMFSNATELIFSPAGMKQLWHGKPHMYSGVTRANHWDHIHLAMQAGGLVPGHGIGDRVPALLEPGEYVVSKPQVRRAGVGALDALNAGSAGGVTNNYNFNAEVHEASMVDRILRDLEARQRAASFRAGVTA